MLRLLPLVSFFPYLASASRICSCVAGCPSMPCCLLPRRYSTAWLVNEKRHAILNKEYFGRRNSVLTHCHNLKTMKRQMIRLMLHTVRLYNKTRCEKRASVAVLLSKVPGLSFTHDHRSSCGLSYFRLRQGRFLPNPLQFINHETSYILRSVVQGCTHFLENVGTTSKF